ncbi:CHT4 [Candida metapsilosis]|uniref:chitinase n=1 Tax=Candida metapsilosis TaxID=273372 RepID=A0A8H7Z8B6_9ASCO|nr:CHT4 [Candida metapsilosis]
MCHRLVEKFQDRLHHSGAQQTVLSGDHKFKTCVYFTNWAVYDKKHFPFHLPSQYYTHIFYAFITIDSESGKIKFSDKWCDLEMPEESLIPGESVHGNLQQLYQMKKLNRSLKVMMSIGGWGTDHLFEAIISSEEKLQNFVGSCVDYVEEFGFDGVDIDWEYPKNSKQGSRFVDLLRLLRERLPPRYSLTVAAPAGIDNIKHLNISEMDQYLSFWNLMCYDFAGQGWSQKTAFHSNLFGNNGDNDMNVSDVVQTYLSKGVIPSKLVVGCPMYGRVFSGVNRCKIGDGFSKNQATNSNDVVNYNEISCFPEQHFDARKVGAYAYDPESKRLVTFDNDQSAKIKGNFVKSKALGGGMWWDSSGDKVASSRPLPDSLVTNFVDQLGGISQLERSENCLLYPKSKYLKNLLP